MEVIENPKLNHIRGGLIGTFAVVSIDPVASVAALRDAKATHAASQLPRVKFLAIISLPSNHNPYLPMAIQPMRLRFFGAGQGLDVECPYAAVGLFPGAPHPPGRAPLIPSSPLPWPNCYVHSLLGFTATVSRLHTIPPELRTSLTIEQCTSIVVSSVEDAFRHGAELRVAEQQGKARTSRANGSNVHASSASAASHREDVAELPLDDYADTETISEDFSTSDSSEESSPHGDGSYILAEPQEMRLYVEVWLDLSVVDVIGTSMEVVNVFPLLKAIEEEWMERASVATPVDETLIATWTRAVDVEASGLPGASRPESACINRETAEPHTDGNDELSPEDAIEHRIAAERRLKRAAKKAANVNENQDLEPRSHLLKTSVMKLRLLKVARSVNARLRRLASATTVLFTCGW